MEKEVGERRPRRALTDARKEQNRVAQRAYRRHSHPVTSILANIYIPEIVIGTNLILQAEDRKKPLQNQNLTAESKPGAAISDPCSLPLQCSGLY